MFQWWEKEYFYNRRGVLVLQSVVSSSKENKSFQFHISKLHRETKRIKLHYQDAMAKFKMQVQISSSFSVFSNLNCNPHILILGNKHFMGCLRKVHSWPSKKGSLSFLVLKENLSTGKKSRQHLPTEGDPEIPHWATSDGRNVSGVLNPGQLWHLAQLWCAFTVEN